jgi:hypothetical protein
MIQVNPRIDDRDNGVTSDSSLCVDPPYSGGNGFDGSAAPSSAGLCCGSNFTIRDYIVDTPVASKRVGLGV